MEGLLKEGGGGDHLSIGVKLPSGVEEKPIVNNIYIKPPVGKLPVFFSFKVFLLFRFKTRIFLSLRIFREKRSKFSNHANLVYADVS